MKKFFLIFISHFFWCEGLIAAEAGMPQLDPKYWGSQIFWLIIVFLSIYLLIAKIFIPKIKNNIDTRESKIRKDLEEAKNFKEEAEKKLKIYNDLMSKAKIDSKKIIFESRQKLNESMQIKRDAVKKEIDTATKEAEKEIKKFKSDSINKISLMSENISSDLLKNILGEDVNQSSIKAIVSEIIKKENKSNL